MSINVPNFGHLGPAPIGWAPPETFIPIPAAESIDLKLTKDVPKTVERLMNEIVNLPVWQYEILMEEVDKFINGPAPRVNREA